MNKFVKKPVEITAFLFDGTWDSARVLVTSVPHITWNSLPSGGYLTINTLEGTMTADTGDWIIRGVKGEYYPCKPDIFALTYEAVKPPLTWLQRVHAEHKDLADKVQALRLYMLTDAFKGLSKAERSNLETQSRHMNGYLSVLDARIAYYEATR